MKRSYNNTLINNPKTEKYKIELNQLPNEILYKIFLHLNFNDLKSVKETCSLF